MLYKKVEYFKRNLLVNYLCWLVGGNSVSSFIEVLLLIIILVIILTGCGSVQLKNRANLMAPIKLD